MRPPETNICSLGASGLAEVLRDRARRYDVNAPVSVEVISGPLSLTAYLVAGRERYTTTYDLTDGSHPDPRDRNGGA